jgi:hypothetical protein
MNFDEAIQAHAAWKVKLLVYTRKPDGALKASEAGVPNRCALGQWLYGSGAKYSALPEYEALVAEHARFHKTAAGVIERADRGSIGDPEKALDENSEFGMVSRNVVKAIRTLQEKTAGA